MGTEAIKQVRILDAGKGTYCLFPGGFDGAGEENVEMKEGEERRLRETRGEEGKRKVGGKGRLS